MSVRADARLLAAGAVVLAGCLIVGWEARHSTFTADDWTFVLDRQGWSAHAILSPHNEHLAALPVLAFKLLLAGFGLRTYLPYAVLLIACHGLACLALYGLCRRYVGPWLALAPTAILAVLGPAWHVLLFYASITFTAAVAAGLGMALCLERHDRLGDVGAAVLLAVALLTSSVGLAMVVLAVVLVALQRPLAWRRFLVVALPVAAYLAWYAQYGVNTVKWSNLAHLPDYVFRAASAAAASVTGLGQTHTSPYLVSARYGHFVIVAAVVFFGWRLIRGLRPPPVTWAAICALLVLWIAQTLEYVPNGREANQSRYQYAAAALLLLIAASAARGWRPRFAGGVVVAAVSAAVCVANVLILRDRTAFWTSNSAYARAETGALQTARGIAPSSYAPENLVNIAIFGNHNLTPITAGPYFAAGRRWGSAADTPQRLLSEPEYAREPADLVVSSAEGIGPVPVAVAGTPRRGCLQVGSRAGLELTLNPGSRARLQTASQPAQVAMRRFASAFRYAHWAVAPHRTVEFQLPLDQAAVPWLMGVLGAGTAVCPGPPV